jgi:hypothetical protein
VGLDHAAFDIDSLVLIITSLTEIAAHQGALIELLALNRTLTML